MRRKYKDLIFQTRIFCLLHIPTLIEIAAVDCGELCRAVDHICVLCLTVATGVPPGTTIGVPTACAVGTMPGKMVSTSKTVNRKTPHLRRNVLCVSIVVPPKCDIELIDLLHNLREKYKLA